MRSPIFNVMEEFVKFLTINTPKHAQPPKFEHKFWGRQGKLIFNVINGAISVWGHPFDDFLP